MIKKILFMALLLTGLAAVSFVVLVFWPLAQAPEARAPQPEPPNAGTAPMPTAATPTPPMASKPTSPASHEWEQKLERILADSDDSPAAARALFAAMPTLPVQALEQYIPHALDRCGDEEFFLAEEIYFHPGMPGFVTEAIFEDALNRPDEVKLPFMAKTILSPKHPMAAEARALLETYLQLEPGAAPPDSWDVAVKKYLAQNQQP